MKRGRDPSNFSPQEPLRAKAREDLQTVNAIQLLMQVAKSRSKQDAGISRPAALFPGPSAIQLLQTAPAPDASIADASYSQQNHTFQQQQVHHAHTELLAPQEVSMDCSMDGDASLQASDEPMHTDAAQETQHTLAQTANLTVDQQAHHQVAVANASPNHGARRNAPAVALGSASARVPRAPSFSFMTAPCTHCGKVLMDTQLAQCAACMDIYCSVCSVVDYQEREDRVFCLDCYEATNGGQAEACEGRSGRGGMAGGSDHLGLHHHSSASALQHSVLMSPARGGALHPAMLAAAGLSTHSHLKATLSHMPTPSRNAEAATNSMNSSGKGPLVVGAGVRNHPTSPLSLFLSHSHSMPQPESHSHSGPRSLSKGHPHTLAFDGPPHLHGSAGKHLHGILNGSLSNTGNTAAGMLVPGGRPPASPSPVLALLSGGLHTSNSLAGGLGGFSSPTAHRSTNAQDNAHASKENAWSPHGAMGLLPLVVPSTGKGGQPGTSTKAGGMPVSMRSPFHNGKIQGASSLPAHSNQAAGGATSHVASAGATNALIGLSSGGGMGVSSASGIHASGAGTPMGFGQRATGRVPSSPMVSGGLAAALTRFAC